MHDMYYGAPLSGIEGEKTAIEVKVRKKLMIIYGRRY